MFDARRMLERISVALNHVPHVGCPGDRALKTQSRNSGGGREKASDKPGHDPRERKRQVAKLDRKPA